MGVPLQMIRDKRFAKHFRQFITHDRDKQAFKAAYLLLKQGKPLPDAYHDHQLRHQRKGIRDFHLNDDMVVVYYRIVNEQIQFLDVGAHSKLFKKYKKF